MATKKGHEDTIDTESVNEYEEIPLETIRNKTGHGSQPEQLYDNCDPPEPPGQATKPQEGCLEPIIAQYLAGKTAPEPHQYEDLKLDRGGGKGNRLPCALIVLPILVVFLVASAILFGMYLRG